MKKQECECCKKEIDKETNRKFCNNCSLFVSGLKRKVSILKGQVSKLRKKIYGVEDGRQK